MLKRRRLQELKYALSDIGINCPLRLIQFNFEFVAEIVKGKPTLTLFQ